MKISDKDFRARVNSLRKFYPEEPDIDISQKVAGEMLDEIHYMLREMRKSPLVVGEDFTPQPAELEPGTVTLAPTPPTPPAQELRICPDCGFVRREVCTEPGCAGWPVSSADYKRDCQQYLRSTGAAYPRTCRVCGLGPCQFP